MRGTGRKRLRAGRPTAGALLAGALLAVSVALTSCGAAGGGDGGSDKQGSAAEQRDTAQQNGAARAPGGPGNSTASSGKGSGSSGTGSNAGKGAGKTELAPAHIIRTATVTVETKDVPGALAKARTAVEGAGGYVGNESTDRDAEGHDRSRITLRVPPDEYEAVLGRLSRLGKLLGRQVTAKDVTDEVVDVDSRVKSQRQSVNRVRALMEKAAKISDIVSLESELSTRQAELESLEARLKSLQERTGTATVTLVLREPDAAPDQGRGTSFGEALGGGWHAFTTAVRWVLVAIGAVLPFAAAGAVLFVLWRLLRDRLPGRARPSGAAGAPSRQSSATATPEAVPEAAPEGEAPGDR
ncbi:DUF4349 domain-containing protein [Streptomyces sp. MST-110588]|uniref:DUF4349 domain-containing protein n=1 Tax=Streptomyces sp. MST-110588 TaxID=2833628 RepID=UPI001F5E08DF|nr:DUF4349 domain-containing protein [Streptomyces sp. MST-110588]